MLDYFGNTTFLNMIRSEYNRYIFLSYAVFLFVLFNYVGVDASGIGVIFILLLGLLPFILRCPDCNFPTAKLRSGLYAPPIFKKCGQCDFRYK